MAASTPENKVKRKINEVLKQFKPNLWYYCPIGSQYQSPVVDYIVCVEGRFIAVEAKAPGKKPTERQAHTMTRMRAAGAIAIVVNDDISLRQLARTIASIIAERKDE